MSAAMALWRKAKSATAVQRPIVPGTLAAIQRRASLPVAQSATTPMKFAAVDASFRGATQFAGLRRDRAITIDTAPVTHLFVLVNRLERMASPVRSATRLPTLG